MTVHANDRPIETVRSEVIDQLIMNYSHGELSYAAFERRLDQAMEAEKGEQLMALVADLTLEVDSGFVDKKQRDLGVNISNKPTVDQDVINNVLSKNVRTGQWQVPRQLTVVSVLSSTTLDFTDALFTSETVVIRLRSYLSHATIYVPPQINLVCNTNCVLSSVDNSVDLMRHPGAPTIIIEGTAVMGEIDIKIRRTMKERFLNFAGELKRMLN